MIGAYTPIFEGVFLRLRPVQPEDAAYIHALRVNPIYGRHLSPVTGSIEDQRSWIEQYKLRAAKGSEVYYIIERRDSLTPCGTVRLYNIEADRFTWGSWILDKNKPPKAALESAVLSFGVGFQELGCKLACLDVRVSNAHAEAFYRRFGMCEAFRTENDIFFEYSRTQFEVDREKHLKTLSHEAEE